MVTCDAVNASGGKPETSNRSEEAARRLVPPQAMSGFRPSPMIGRPGTIIPTRWKEGERIPTSIHRFGKDRPRCGSEASIAAPEALRAGAIATALLPAREKPAKI